MASSSLRRSPSPSFEATPGQSLCLIVGLACLGGFLVDFLILLLPPQPFDIQWRVGLLQQVGDRSIVLLLGLSLTLYGILDNRRLRKQLALLCLGLGVMFALSGLLTVRDSLKLQDLTVTRIASQEAQVRDQIATAQANPQQVSPDLTPELLQQASQILTDQVDVAKRTATTNVLKVGANSVGNLIVTGLALIAVGRFGSRTRG
ncbi:HpsJ family protein [Leptolyngbya sp. KIOST-1]|uniref:HpsJ-like protein, cyanoexosortase C-associated n=1 Tax=Leptolyngbya sp. KIOST-1 TaxID=1229172 RepID=UPI00068B12EF|nr:HpsJ family protein [Leptolyngbya sp. KIOST-1]